MTKPRDICGNDLLVPCTAWAMIIARLEGKGDDLQYVKHLSFKLHSDALKYEKDQLQDSAAARSCSS